MSKPPQGDSGVSIACQRTSPRDNSVTPRECKSEPVSPRGVHDAKKKRHKHRSRDRIDKLKSNDERENKSSSSSRSKSSRSGKHGKGAHTATDSDSSALLSMYRTRIQGGHMAPRETLGAAAGLISPRDSLVVRQRRIKRMSLGTDEPSPTNLAARIKAHAPGGASDVESCYPRYSPGRGTHADGRQHAMQSSPSGSPRGAGLAVREAAVEKEAWSASDTSLLFLRTLSPRAAFNKFNKLVDLATQPSARNDDTGEIEMEERDVYEANEKFSKKSGSSCDVDMIPSADDILAHISREDPSKVAPALLDRAKGTQSMLPLGAKPRRRDVKSLQMDTDNLAVFRKLPQGASRRHYLRERDEDEDALSHYNMYVCEVDGWLCTMKDVALETLKPSLRESIFAELNALQLLPYHRNVSRIFFFQQERFLDTDRVYVFTSKFELSLAKFLEARSNAGMSGALALRESAVSGLSERLLPLPDIKKMLLDIVDGLIFLSNHAVLHRDLRPENIFVHMSNGDVVHKLAVANYDSTKLVTKHPPPLEYIPPEVLNRGFKAHTLASTVWMLGLVLYEILYLRTVYSALSVDEIRENISAGTRPAPLHLPFNYHSLADLFEEATMRDPQSRPELSLIRASLQSEGSIRTHGGNEPTPWNIRSSRSSAQWSVAMGKLPRFSNLVDVRRIEDWSAELGYCSLPLPEQPLELIETNFPAYRLYLSNNEHDHYVTERMDDPVIVTIDNQPWTSDREKGSKNYRCVVWSKEGSSLHMLECMSQRDRVREAARLSVLCANSAEPAKLIPLRLPSLSYDLLVFEKTLFTSQYKFGVLYCKSGQTTEDEMFSNRSGSHDFNEFLLFLGDRIVLEGFTGFRGGLDITQNATGTHSIYTTASDCEIMFHVSTMLPHCEGDLQQLEKKRHLGNDVVVIIFRDEGTNTPFNPSVMHSHFNHVFVIIQPVKKQAEVSYELAFISKAGVSPHAPFLNSSTFRKCSYFRELLLVKLINAERAAMDAPDFRSILQRTRINQLTEMISKRKQRTKLPKVPKLLFANRGSTISLGRISPRGKADTADPPKPPTLSEQISSLPGAHSHPPPQAIQSLPGTMPKGLTMFAHQTSSFDSPGLSMRRHKNRRSMSPMPLGKGEEGAGRRMPAAATLVMAEALHLHQGVSFLSDPEDAPVMRSLVHEDTHSRFRDRMRTTMAHRDSAASQPPTSATHRRQKSMPMHPRDNL